MIDELITALENLQESRKKKMLLPNKGEIGKNTSD